MYNSCNFILFYYIIGSPPVLSLHMEITGLLHMVYVHVWNVLG